jgi:hypothetical protein
MTQNKSVRIQCFSETSLRDQSKEGVARLRWFVFVLLFHCRLRVVHSQFGFCSPNAHKNFFFFLLLGAGGVTSAFGVLLASKQQRLNSKSYKNTDHAPQVLKNNS